MRVGFIGLGRMGRPMCRHLIDAGHDVVVHNRTRTREDSLVALGAEPAGSPGELASRCDAVLACLPSLDATRQVFLAPDGVVARAAPGSVLVDHSTISPALAREVAEAAGQRGLSFLDAPVSGGPAGAEAGTLTIMAGGDPAAFRTVQPLLDAMGGNVRHVGPVGAGSVVKLVNQLLTFVHATAAAEAFLLGRAGGAGPGDLLPILETAWGASTMLLRGGEKYEKRDFDAGAPLRLFEKDMGLVRELAKDAGLELPLVEAAAGRLHRALEAGLADADLVAVLRPYEDDSGMIVGP